MTLGDMRRLLAARGLQLTRALGQNFLHDANQLRCLTALGHVQPGDRVLEIGPGLGPLTGHLLAAGATVCALETDRRLIEVLRERFRAEPRLEVRHADALADLRDATSDWSGWKVVANLPFSVASPILVALALHPRGPAALAVIVQFEVAQRLMASAGTADYGVLTLLVQLRYAVRFGRRIPASCFFPEPGVDSASIQLERHAEPLLPGDLEPAFVGLVKQAFSQRRKMMLKLLKAHWPEAQLLEAYRAVGLETSVRAEAVTRTQFAALAQRLHAKSPPCNAARPRTQGAADRSSGAETGGRRALDLESSRIMPEEVFDVVNERDEVVGAVFRREVHRLGLRHRAVHVLVFNGRGEVFLQKRSSQKDCFPGCWDSSASGHLDRGESYDACAVREVREELGWTLPAVPERLFKLEACAATGQEFVWVYRARAAGPFTLAPAEIAEGAWFAVDAVDRWVAERGAEFASAFPAIWARYRGGGETADAPPVPGPP